MKAQYIRVSTLEQNTERQTIISGAKQYLDKISGTIPLFERPQGKKLYEDIEAGLVEELYVHSIDRLGRNTLDILSTINYLNQKGVCLVSDKEGIRTLIDGKENLTSKLIVNILATLSEFENNIRKERQAEGIAIAKLKGVYAGRKRGTLLSSDKFLEKHKNVLKELEKGESIRRVAKLCGVSTGTVQKVKRIVAG
ncbi:recombinase family protein [Pseudofulvibacter geojedonensis]|uniref:Recombinase family protein n=1 Tax=Pseudofulvibacter geojedonensis TaxID=1123758 RepID=A0ABW3I226_9FLAO